VVWNVGAAGGNRVEGQAVPRRTLETDYNLYEGTEVTGPPETVLLRGNVLVENGDLVAEPGVGQFVERAAFGQELLPAAAR